MAGHLGVVDAREVEHRGVQATDCVFQGLDHAALTRGIRDSIEEVAQKIRDATAAEQHLHYPEPMGMGQGLGAFGRLPEARELRRAGGFALRVDHDQSY